MEGLPREIGGGAIPIKAWAHYIEAGAEQQARNAANHPFAFHHIALMPDAHQGEGICIGGVGAFNGVVLPNFSGVDLGCGVSSIKTSLNINDVNNDLLLKIRDDITSQIPVGFDHRTTPLKDKMPVMDRAAFEQSAVVKAEWDSATYQIGTLGGGK